METNQLVGLILIVVGALDPLIGMFLIAPRIPDENRRRMVTISLVASGAVMTGLGVAFLLGVLPGGIRPS